MTSRIQHFTAVNAVILSISVFAALPAHTLGGGSASWTGNQDSDYYNTNNWTGGLDASDPAFLPNGNITFRDSALTGVRSTTVDRNSGSYTYIYGLYFNNTLGSQNSYTINGANKLFIGGSVIRTAAVSSGSLTNVINADIQKAGNHEVFDIGQNHDLIVNGVIFSSGGLTKTGAGTLTFSGNNTYTGGTTNNQGTLLINGITSGQGPYIVTNNAILGGSGTIGLNSSSVTISDGCTVTPGNNSNVATLTVNGSFVFCENAVYSWDFGSDNGDQVTVNGNLTLPATAIINITELNEEMPNTGVLFSASSLSGASDLDAWIVNDASNTYKGVRIDGTQVVLIEVPKGTVIILN